MRTQHSAPQPSPPWAFANPASSLGFGLTDITTPPASSSVTTAGAYGGKLLPETLWVWMRLPRLRQRRLADILLLNGMTGRSQTATIHPPPLPQQSHGTFADVTRSAGLDVEMYGNGVAVGDYNNDGFADIFITCVGRAAFSHTGKGTRGRKRVRAASLWSSSFSTSALWLITTVTACSTFRLQLPSLVP